MQPEKMSITQIVAGIQDTQENLTVDDMVALARRLTEIAMFDHGVSDEDRVVAFELRPAIDAEIEEALKDDPAALEAYQDAATYHRSTARHVGYGSLHWLLEEQNIPAAEVIDFISREEAAELLPEYLEMMDPETIKAIRPAVLDALGRLRAKDGADKLATLHRLAGENDGALMLLLTGDELIALREADRPEGRARTVLRRLGIHP